MVRKGWFWAMLYLMGASRWIKLRLGSLRLPPPTSFKGVQGFLDHAEFYNCFTMNFSKIAKPLTQPLPKDCPFVFTDERLEAFCKIKQTLISATIIQPPNWSLLLEIMCDVSDHAVGAVLWHRKDKKSHVIYYASKAFDEAQ